VIRLTDIFSTRELALFTWLLVVITLLLFSKSLRRPIGDILKILFSKKIFTALLILVIYTLTSLYLLNQLGLWDKSLTKDTVFWFFTVALVTFFTVNKAKDSIYFKSILIDSLKWIILFEFLVNFYTLSYWTELILLPAIFLISTLHVFSSADKKNESVTKLLGTILNLIGVAFFLYVLYETVLYYRQAFTTQNLKSLIHPIVMTAIFVPFVYLLKLLMDYEYLFVRVGTLTTDKKIRNRVKRQIFMAAKLNMNKLSTISKNLHLKDFTPDDIKGFVKRLVE
jgi:hypothetical protein